MRKLLIRKRKATGKWHVIQVTWNESFFTINEIARLNNFGDVLVLLNAVAIKSI